MNEIKCPHCGKTFKVDESDYSKLLSQIRNEEFKKELNREKELSSVEYEKKVFELENKIKSYDKDKEIEILNIRNKNETEVNSLKEQLRSKDAEIAYIKEMKSRLSTKMIGESLEQFCWNEFEKVRPLFPSSIYFEKDSDITEGSKGDFILREQSESGDLYSIMFEMKNESDETATKHKNEDFFKKLDKDRNDKKCEYAVLVSTLEADSDLYNAGIVDISHKYPKMYVVRPQCFIPIITIIRNACLKSLEYKNELDMYKAQNYDFEEFENKMNSFKEGFNKNYELAKNKFDDAITNIDKTISNLQKVKENLLSSQKQLRYADDKISSFDIKKIAKGNKTITALMDKSKNKD